MTQAFYKGIYAFPILINYQEAYMIRNFHKDIYEISIKMEKA